jgi:hypothetical protein
MQHVRVYMSEYRYDITLKGLEVQVRHLISLGRWNDVISIRLSKGTGRSTYLDVLEVKPL